MNLFQADLISIAKIETHFCAAPSSVIWIGAMRLCIQIWWSGVFAGSGPIIKINLAVTAFR